MDEYLESPAESRAFTRQVLSTIEILQKNYNMQWEEITKEIVNIVSKSPVGMQFASGVITEFMNIISRRTNEAICPEIGMTKTEVLTELSNAVTEKLFFEEFPHLRKLKKEHKPFSETVLLSTEGKTKEQILKDLGNAFVKKLLKFDAKPVLDTMSRKKDFN